MKSSTRKIVKFALELLAAAISAALTALGTTSCMGATGLI